MCACRLSFSLSSHRIVAAQTPLKESQQHVSSDVIYYEGTSSLHSVELCITWSEVPYFSRRGIYLQISVFQQMQLLRHGRPNSIKCNPEYDNNLFSRFCEESDITLFLVAASVQEGSGLIETANRTLRSFLTNFGYEKSELRPDPC